MLEELLKTKANSQKADIKAQRIVDISPTGDYTLGDTDIEIRKIEKIPGGMQVFIRALKGGKPVGFGDGTIEIEKVKLINPPVLVPIPDGNILRTYFDDLRGENKVRKFVEDPAQALRDRLFHVVKVAGLDGSRIIPGKVGQTTSTANPVAGTGTAPIDARLRRRLVDETFGTIRAGAGNDTDETTGQINLLLHASTTSNQFQTLARFGFGFDTSSTPDTDTVSSASITIYGDPSFTNGLGTPNVDITSFTPSDPSNFANSDFNVANYGSTRFATGKAVSSWRESSPNNDNVFTLNASGIANISKTTNDFFGMRLSWDVDNSFGGAWVSADTASVNYFQADQTGSSNDPLLTWVHAAAVTAKKPISNLLLMGV